MKTKTKPFRERAEKAIRQAVKLRLFLIRNGKSKNGLTSYHCEKVIQDIDVLQSDRQFAKFVLEHGALLEKIMPGPHKKSKVNLEELQTEAPQYL